MSIYGRDLGSLREVVARIGQHPLAVDLVQADALVQIVGDGERDDRFTRQSLNRFCDSDGTIDWVKLVEFNSGNFDLDQFIS